MNDRSLILCAIWCSGAVAYLACAFVSSFLLIRALQIWGQKAGLSRGELYIIGHQFSDVMAICLLLGALYASAFAKPSVFGGALRIWAHLAVSFLLGLLGYLLSVWTFFFPFPDFQSTFVLSSYAFVKLAVSIGSFLLAIAIWARVAFNKVDFEKTGQVNNLPVH